MSHLKLVVTNTPRKRKLPPPADTQRPVPTPEFLARRILALPLGEQTIGALFTEVVKLHGNHEPASLRRYIDLGATLLGVGIWPQSSETDGDVITQAMLLEPYKFVGHYREFRPIQDQIDCLILIPPNA